MTRRRSKRDIERALEALDDGTPDAGDELPDEYVINYQVVGQDGNIVDTFERVLWVGDSG